MSTPLVEHHKAWARNNAWSNHRLLTACAGLDEAALKAERTSFFPSIYLTLNHILIVDWYYLDALEHGGRGLAVFEDETPCAAFADLDREQRLADRRLITFCDGLTDASAAETVTLVREGGPRIEKVRAVLSHLFVHQIHHRGQVHAMLSGTSVPPQLDEFFLDQDAGLRADDLQALGFGNR